MAFWEMGGFKGTILEEIREGKKPKLPRKADIWDGDNQLIKQIMDDGMHLIIDKRHQTLGGLNWVGNMRCKIK